MFCIKCGKIATVGSFCDEHFLEKERLFEIENITIDVCERCGSYFDGEWKKAETTETVDGCHCVTSYDIDDAVKRVIEKSIVTKNKINKINVVLKKFGNKYKAIVRCTGLIKPCKKSKMEEKKILIILHRNKCENCVKVLGKYYEAIIQIRGERRDGILKDINKMIDEKTLSGFKELSHGYDLYFVRKGDANRVAGKLKEKYDIKRSFKFATEKKGKKLYRNYFAVR